MMPARRVLIVKNKFTFLSLPKLPEVLAIWGQAERFNFWRAPSG